MLNRYERKILRRKTFEELGTQFETLRKARGLSIEDIAAVTKQYPTRIAKCEEKRFPTSTACYIDNAVILAAFYDKRLKIELIDADIP